MVYSVVNYLSQIKFERRFVKSRLRPFGRYIINKVRHLVEKYKRIFGLRVVATDYVKNHYPVYWAAMIKSRLMDVNDSVVNGNVNYSRSVQSIKKNIKWLRVKRRRKINSLKQLR